MYVSAMVVQAVLMVRLKSEIGTSYAVLSQVVLVGSLDECGSSSHFVFEDVVTPTTWYDRHRRLIICTYAKCWYELHLLVQ